MHCTSKYAGEPTVQYSFAKRHDGRAEGDENGNSSLASQDLLSAGDGDAILVVYEEVVEVHDGLEDVQEALGGGEAAAGVEGLPAVDVVDLAVQLVGGPEGPV